MGKLENVKAFLFAAITIVFVGSVYAQDAPIEPPKAKLIEAVSTMRSACEYRLAVMDRFFVELGNDPNAQGFVVVRAMTNPVWMTKSRADEVRRHISRRSIDPARVTIVEAEPSGDAKTEFWIVPPGAENPEVKGGDGVVNGPPVAKITKPKNFTAANPDGCYWGDLYIEGYATELNFGWEYPGRVVIHSKTLKNFQNTRRELTEELGRLGITSKRLTFVRRPATNGEEWVELWILPVKKGAKPKVELPPGM